MKKFLSVFLVCLLLIVPAISLNCLATGETQDIYGAVYVVNDQAGNAQNKLEVSPQAEMKPKSKFISWNTIKFILKMGMRIVVPGVGFVLLLDHFSNDGHVAKLVGSTFGEAIGSFKVEHPEVLNYLQAIPSKVEKFNTFSKGFYNAVYNLIAKNVNAFKIGLDEGLQAGKASEN
ncbi:MAG: hypothetical protein RUMPE_01018 [Eubacteriales bacterium SKADARSKE-1]|nr:hypothetical protein [Eubacteriales bacterium SKADARSKE-1]